MDVRFPAFQLPPTGGRPGSTGAGVGAGTGAAPGSLAATGSGGVSGVAGPGSVQSFSGALNDALQGVSRLQEESVSLQHRFLAGAEGASLEQTMMAMQKSQVAFQAALTVRNRLVAAYTDIMNMPV